MASPSGDSFLLPRLQRGDRVAVIAPSSPIRREMLDAGLEQVRRLGLQPVVGEGIDARHLFFAGTDERRLGELLACLSADAPPGIFVARGGYGLTPLLPRLPAGAPPPRLLLGESDATALGCWALTRGLGWLHGPMVAGAMRLGSAGHDEASLRSALFEEGGEISPAGTRALRAGEAEGVTWGGCLTLLASLCGTPWLPRMPRSLLVIEDVGVKPYQVHRMLVQLRDAGALEGVAGVILGDFSDCVQHADQGYDVADVLAELLASALGPVPVSIGWPIGHAAAPHVTIPMGARARLVVPEAAPPRLAWRR
jgi:muramoyltetrapeptide carboxypeptidase